MIDSWGLFSRPSDQRQVDKVKRTPDTIAVLQIHTRAHAPHFGFYGFRFIPRQTNQILSILVFLCFVYFDPNPGSVLQFIHFIDIKNGRERSEGKSLCHKAFSSPLLHPAGFVFTTSAQPVFV